MSTRIYTVWCSGASQSRLHELGITESFRARAWCVHWARTSQSRLHEYTEYTNIYCAMFWRIESFTRNDSLRDCQCIHHACTRWMFLWVSIYVYIYICTHIYAHVYMYINVHLHVYIHINVYMHMNICSMFVTIMNCVACPWLWRTHVMTVTSIEQMFMCM